MLKQAFPPPALQPGLIPVPSQLFQGSLFLGTMARLAFGGDVVTHASVYVHPLLIGGWCGMVTTAFNALPCGNLDGGRGMLVRLPAAHAARFVLLAVLRVPAARAALWCRPPCCSSLLRALRRPRVCPPQFWGTAATRARRAMPGICMLKVARMDVNLEVMLKERECKDVHK